MVAGENVASAEIEAVVAAHPRVFEVAVVGEEDPVRDEVPVAFVVPAPGAVVPDPEELHSWCAERLAPVKRPRRFVVVPELPRTSVGKIRKFMLRPGADPRADASTSNRASGGARTSGKEITG
jgi:crotonobetaine/carnitine-CoA ligase